MKDLYIILTLAAIAMVGVLSILSIKRCSLPRRQPRIKPYKAAAGLVLLALAGLDFWPVVANAAEPLRMLDPTRLQPAPQHFNAQEWNLDLYGTGSIANESRNPDDVSYGAGAGLTYWVTRGLGFGVRAEVDGLRHGFNEAEFSRGMGRVSVRAPLWDRAAPYGYAEGGYNILNERWLAGAGGGLDFRIAKGWGLFAEAGLEVTTPGAGGGRGSAGVRLTW